MIKGMNYLTFGEVIPSILVLPTMNKSCTISIRQTQKSMIIGVRKNIQEIMLWLI